MKTEKFRLPMDMDVKAEPSCHCNVHISHFGSSFPSVLLFYNRLMLFLKMMGPQMFGVVGCPFAPFVLLSGMYRVRSVHFFHVYHTVITTQTSRLH